MCRVLNVEQNTINVQAKPSGEEVEKVELVEEVGEAQVVEDATDEWELQPASNGSERMH